MPVANVRAVLREFVEGELEGPLGARTALALTGRWGIGKTYVWKDVVREALEGGWDRRYAYVSLFGLNSIDEVRSALVTAVAVNSLPTTKVGGKLVSAAADAVLQGLESVPVVGKFIAGAGGTLGEALAFELVRDALVCLDDLERLGDGLTVKDVFGVVTQLRDERSCDVAVLLNSGQLGDEGEDEFRMHGEKAVDIHLTLSPSPTEAFEIGFADWATGDDDLHALVLECCVRLDISNIRLLHRVRRTLDTLLEPLDAATSDTVEDAVRGAVLLTWARHRPEGEGPDFEAVRSPEPVYRFLVRSGERTPEERALLDLYKRYGYSTNAGVDQVTADLVETGWVDGEALARAVADADAVAGRLEGRRRVQAAWALYNESFDDNEEAFVTALSAASVEEAAHNNVSQADEAVQMLRTLDRDDLADRVIDAFMEAHADDPAVLRYGASRARADTAEDPTFDERLRAFAAERTAPRSLRDVAVRVAGDLSWNPGDLEVLASGSVDEYVDLLVGMDDDTARYRFVDWALTRPPDVDASNPAITEAVRSALVQIGRSGRLNRLRVERFYKVPVPPEDGEQAGG